MDRVFCRRADNGGAGYKEGWGLLRLKGLVVWSGGEGNSPSEDIAGGMAGEWPESGRAISDGGSSLLEA